MATNPFAKYAQGYQADPIIAPADPYKQASEARAQAGEVRASQDQAFQAEANQRAAAAEERANRAERRAVQTEQRSAQKDAMGTVEQGKSAGFLRRALNSNATYEAQDLGARSLVGQGLSEYAPNLLNSLPGQVGNSPKRQVADANQDEFIAATLRYESGAAIPPSEIEQQRRRYFPMPGDGEDVIKAKDELRRQAIEALKLSAGPVAGRVEQEFQQELAGRRKSIGEQDAPPPINDQEGLQVHVTDETPGAPPAGPTPPTGGTTLGDISTLAQQGVTLGLSDEAAGIGGYLSGFLTGRDPQAEYTRSRDAERARIAGARERHPVVGTLAEFLGGGGAARVASAPNALSGVVRQGAALGGVGGFGYGEGAQDSVAGAAAGSVLGGALGGAMYGAGRGINAFTARRAGPAPTAEQADLIAAGQRQNVPLRQPDVRPELRNRMAQAETTETAGPMIRQARADDANLIEQRVSEVGGQGGIADPYALGSRVQDAGRRYIANTKQQATRLYDTARNEAQGASVQPTEALSVIDQNIAELQAAGENTNAGQIGYLQNLRADLDRPLTVEAVQNLRTNMRGQLSGQGLTGTDAERRVSQVIDAANRDLVRDLPQNASSALRAADDFYRQRQTFINETLNQFMGSRGNPLPAETAANRLVSMTKGTGNYRRFSSMWGQLEPSEQADVAATVAESLGRKRNGEFSPATLIQSLDPNKGINPRTARLIFGDDGAQALNDLRAIARAKTETQNALNNSRTGTAVNAAAGGLKGLLMTAFGFSQGGVVGAVAAPMATRFLAGLGERRAARLLLNPDFTRWLRNAPSSGNPRTIDRYFSRISGKLAANDNEALRKAFVDAFSTSPASRAAAGEQNQDVRGEPVQ